MELTAPKFWRSPLLLRAVVWQWVPIQTKVPHPPPGVSSHIDPFKRGEIVCETIREVINGVESWSDWALPPLDPLIYHHDHPTLCR